MQFLISLAPLLLALVILTPAVTSDLRSARIPNSLCAWGFVAGLVLHTVLQGWIGLASSLAGGLLLLLLMFPFFALGWLGAGDVKLIATTGAIGGSPMVGLAIVSAIVVAGVVLALSLRLWHTGLKELAARATSSGPGFYLTTSFLTKVPIAVRKTPSAPIKQFPYAVAIMAGTVAALAVAAMSQ